jgi:predicted HD phosphohydrolase
MRPTRDVLRATFLRYAHGLRRRLRAHGLPVPRTPRRFRFRAMTEGGPWQWMEIREGNIEYERGTPQRLMAILTLLEGEPHGFAIDRLQHCLQAATRAQRDGQPESYVACALLHDIGAAIAPRDHAEFAALLLKPYISEAEHWMVAHHQLFQSYYYHHHTGGDRDLRERFRGHPHFDKTEEFVRLYDQTAFDPDYDTLPLEHFAALLDRVMARSRG